MASITIPVTSMHCQNCVNAVKGKLSSLPGVASVDVDLQKGQAVIAGEGVDVATVKEAIDDLGFEAGDPV